VARRNPAPLGELFQVALHLTPARRSVGGDGRAGPPHDGSFPASSLSAWRG